MARTIAHVLAENVRSHRERQGLTHEQLAEKSGVSTSTIQSIEYLRRWPGLDTISAVSAVLGVQESALFSDPGVPHAAATPLSDVRARVLAAVLPDAPIEVIEALLKIRTWAAIDSSLLALAEADEQSETEHADRRTGS